MTTISEGLAFTNGLSVEKYYTIYVCLICLPKFVWPTSICKLHSILVSNRVWSCQFSKYIAQFIATAWTYDIDKSKWPRMYTYYHLQRVPRRFPSCRPSKVENEIITHLQTEAIWLIIVSKRCANKPTAKSLQKKFQDEKISRQKNVDHAIGLRRNWRPSIP